MIVKVVIVSHTTLHFGFVLLLLLDNFYDGAMAPILRVYLPGIDEHSYGGAIVLNAFNYVILLIGHLIVVPFDLLIYIIFINMLMVASIIAGRLGELRERLPDEKRNLTEIRNRLIQIIFMHKKYNE